jgi:hypothetical protein
VRSFQSSLTAGHQTESRWVHNQQEAGLCVFDGVKIVAENHCKYRDHTDAPDAAALVAIEIKERSLRFTCPEDYPYDRVFVDDLRGLRREGFTKFAYVFLSKPTGQWVWLCTLDRDETWREEETRDNTRGHAMGILTAPKSHLRPCSTLSSVLLPQSFLKYVQGVSE